MVLFTKKQVLMNMRRMKWYFERFYGKKKINYRNQGFINFIDVGAAGWLPKPWSKTENSAIIHHVLRFEPQEKNWKTKNVTTINQPLWRETATRKLYTFGGEMGGASLFKQNYEFVKNNYEELSKLGKRRLAITWFERAKLDRVLQVDCRSLDHVLTELNQPYCYHFLKIDAQGAESEILLGAEQFLLSSCIGIQVELFTLPLLKGIKLLPEVVALLDEYGFDLVYKSPAQGSFNSQHDCVFIKRNNNNSKIKRAIERVYQLDITNK